MKIIIELNDNEKDVLLQDIEKVVKEQGVNLLQKATTVEKDDKKNRHLEALKPTKKENCSSKESAI